MSKWRTRDPAQLETDLVKNVPQKPVFATLTLTASATSTTLTNAALRPTSEVVWVPQTSNAAGALSGMYRATPTQGQVVIHHASTADTDKTFGILIFNG